MLRPEGHPLLPRTADRPTPVSSLDCPGWPPGKGREEGLPFDNDNDNNVALKLKFRQKTTSNGVEPKEDGISKSIKRT